MYKSKHFDVEEFIDPITYAKFGDMSIRYMDYRLVIFMDCIRILTNSPITINDYKWGGKRKWSGTRTPESPWYSTHSGHSWGRAIDFRVKGWSPEALHKLIHDNWDELKEASGLQGLRMEHTDHTPNWVHIDSLQEDGKIYTFRIRKK